MKSIFLQNKEIVQDTNTTLTEAIEALGTSPIKLLLITNDRNQLVGTVTDGDIRRGLLNGIKPHQAVADIMNMSPIVAKENEDPSNYLKLLKKKNPTLIPAIPVVNDKQELVDILLIERNTDHLRENPVLILAGGLGSRLGDLTKQTPKPLIPIGETPIIEMIIQNLVKFGFRKFFISLNYLGEQIKNSLGHGQKWNCEIQYLEEKIKLGTAGPLSLLEGLVHKPILVINGDIITKVDFDSLLEFHNSHKDAATMCVKEYDMQVPFGVVQLKDSKVINIDEKPVHSFFVNAGINVFDPHVISLVPKNVCFDMPQLFDKLLQSNKGVRAFPMMEYWIDVGRQSDLQKAKSDLQK
ncbi:MAG: nucleotidyltransferase family protein [Oligoflexia bacterium]|nr:nucleotidyltransferase family protein [Oligoflexia bacterium]